MADFKKEKEGVAACMRRLYEQGLTTASGGNVSLRAGNRVLITPSQVDKASVQAGQINVLDLQGNMISGDQKNSMETGMHLAIYQKRPDISAIVHAHPVMATSFAIARKDINTGLAGESRAILGKPARASYRLMGTHELAESVSDAAKNAQVILMENHGVITLGTTLFQAYDRMEVAEAAARMTFVTDYMGSSHTLTPDQLKAIDELFE